MAFAETDRPYALKDSGRFRGSATASEDTGGTVAIEFDGCGLARKLPPRFQNLEARLPILKGEGATDKLAL